MTQFDLTLFNQFLAQQNDDPRTAINHALKANQKNFQLSVADFSGIDEERRQLFTEHHLVDFSWQNTQSLAGFLVEEPIFYKSDFLEHLMVCQALFYYLRSYHPGHVTDHEILEAIEGCYQKYQGDLEMLQGVFEDFSELEGDE